MNALARRLAKLEGAKGPDLALLSDEELETRLRDVDARIRRAGIDLGITLPADLGTATEQWWHETFASLQGQPA